MGLVLSSGKRDISLNPPILNAAGMLGYSEEGGILRDHSLLGGLVTNPVSLAPRTAATGQRVLPFQGGFLLHTGHPNPGLSAVLRKHRPRWATLPCYVIVHLLARTPDELASMVERLEAIEEVAGIEVGLQSGDPEHARALLAAVKGCELPVVACVPLDSTETLASVAVESGAAAISLGPARGAIPGDRGSLVEGRLYGPAFLPWALRVVSHLCHTTPIPVIGAGGIYSRQDVDAMLATGAAAVQLGPVLWTEPEAVLMEAPSSNA